MNNAGPKLVQTWPGAGEMSCDDLLQRAQEGGVWAGGGLCRPGLYRERNVAPYSGRCDKTLHSAVMSSIKDGRFSVVCLCWCVGYVRCS